MVFVRSSHDVIKDQSSSIAFITLKTGFNEFAS